MPPSEDSGGWRFVLARIGPARRRNRRSSGQSLVEFAIVLPVLLLLVAGAVQYALIVNARHSLIEVARDTARWAATQRFNPCSSSAAASPAQPLTEADQLASTASLIGYSAGMWQASNFVSGTTPLPASPPHTEGVEVAWTGSTTCPPVDNTTTAWVTIRLTHQVPVFFPAGLVPGLCGSSGCQLSVSSSAMFRMEPPPE
jgi:Flp pilus assembly protein TadG